MPDEFEGWGKNQRPEGLPIEDVLAEMRDLERPVLTAKAIYGLSNLSGEAQEIFAAAWPVLPVERRRHLMEFLVGMSEVMFDVTLEPIAYVGFADVDAEVRTKSVELPWYVTTERLFHALMKLVKDDPATIVRTKALGGLGKFIYEAEMEEFDAGLAGQAAELAIDLYYDRHQDLEVRRRALEAISRGSHPKVRDMIDEAYHHEEPLMKVSAVFAMGSSCDSERWEKAVIEELDNPNAEIRFEAVRAAGELSLAGAVRRVMELASGGDYEVKMMAVWALGEIGTREAQRDLDDLMMWAMDEEDDEMMEAIEEAQEMASLVSGFILPMFDFDEDDLLDDGDDDLLLE